MEAGGTYLPTIYLVLDNWCEICYLALSLTHSLSIYFILVGNKLVERPKLVDILLVISIEIPRLKNNYVVMLLRANETVRLLTLFYNGIIIVLIYYTKEGTLVIMNTKFFLTILRFQYIKVYLHFAYTLEDQTCWKKSDII